MSPVLFLFAEAPIAGLDPATRATLLLALLAIVLAGVGLIIMVILGGRMVRRWSRFTPPNRPVVKRPHVPVPLDLASLNDDPPDTETII